MSDEYGRVHTDGSRSGGQPKEKYRQIGIDLINEYRQQDGLSPIYFFPINTPEASAFIRSIQLHEKTKQELADCKQELSDFKQKVSDVVEQALSFGDVESLRRKGVLSRFIIPAPKPDPLREIAEAWGLHNTVAKSWVEDLRATLEARGFEIREKNDD
jgi:hypothetical protein